VAQTSGDQTSFLPAQKEGEAVASQMIGAKLVDQSDERLGKVSDLILDEEQRAIGAVLSIGGFLGIGSKTVGVPLEALNFETREGEEVAVVAITKEQLLEAPDFKTVKQQEALRKADEAVRKMQ
jgi:sporulation protein YlmC with PRC-barrel domain